MSSESLHKMYHYEVTPPAGVWEKIAVSLDEADLDLEYPSRLQNAAVIPPSSVWKAIAAQLDESPAIIATPAKTFKIGWIKYAAAAAVLAFLVWGGLQLSKGKSTNSTAANNIPVNNNTAKQSGNNPVDNVPTKVLPVITDDERNDAALEQSKKTYAKVDVPVRTKIRNAAGFQFTLDETEPVPDEQLDPATRYIVLMTPEGNFIRMSKKLSDLVCCVSGEEQDKECTDQLKKWREKVATSTAAYSPGNFGDILNLVKSLQD